MENFLKNRFSEIEQIEEGLSYSTFKGFDNLYQKSVILKVLFPVATKDISLLALLAHLYHRNIISPIDLIPLPGEHYCIVFPEYPRIPLLKNDLREENSFLFALQIRGFMEFLFSKNIGIRNISLRNFSRENETIYLTEFEENIYRIFPFENKEGIETIDGTMAKLSRFIKSNFLSDRGTFKKIKSENPLLITSLFGFDLRRKEDQIIDSFVEEKGLSSPRVMGVFGKEGNGKSIFIRNFIIRNRSTSSPIIFINSTGREEFFNSFLNQLSWLDSKGSNLLERRGAEEIVRVIEDLFFKNGYSSFLIIFDDLDKTDYYVIEFLDKLVNSIIDSLPFKFIFTSESYFPFLKDLQSYHLHLSFSNFNEFRENIWIGHDELDDFVEIAWRKSGGNLNLFHWIMKDPEFWKKGTYYKEKDYTEKELLKNYSSDEIRFLGVISCFPKGFDKSWIKKILEKGREDYNAFLRKGIIEEKGTKLFVKEPWNSIVQENLSSEDKDKIHELGANFDRENSYYHFFMAKKYEEGLDELNKFLENLKNKGKIKDAIDLARSYQEYVEKIESLEKKFNFYYFISELFLKIGDFESAFEYIAKSSQFVKPSSEEWMKLKVKIAESLYGMMKYGKAIEILEESLRFAEIYNFEKYVNTFNYHLSKNLWKIGKHEESEDILKKLELTEDRFFSGISRRDRGYYRFLKGDISGKDLVKSSLKLLENFPLEEAISYKYLACISIKEKKWDESFGLFSKAMRFFEKENDLFNLAGLCSDIGKMFLEKEDLMNSEIWLRKAFDIYSKIDNPRGIILSQFNLTEVMVPFGKWKVAKEILNKCAEMDKKSRNLLSYAYDINSLGYLEFITGNFESAKKLLKESEEIFKNYNATKELIDTKLKLSELLLEMEDFSGVKRIFEEIESLNLNEDLIKEFLNYKLLKAKYFLKRRESKKAEKFVSEIIEKAIQYDQKTTLGNATLLKALILKDKEENEAARLFQKSIDIFQELDNYFLYNLSLLEYFRNFPDKIDLQRAREGLERLKDMGYFRSSEYEDLIFPRERESNSQKLLKFLKEMGRFDWINVFIFQEGKLTLDKAFPVTDLGIPFPVDISVLVPKIFKREEIEILQIPIIKSGILMGFILCGKKEAIENSDIELILSFTEPIYTLFFKKEKEEKDGIGLEASIIGGSSIKKIIEIINKIKDFNYPVLIIGESGTGKELIARYIHNSSSRRNSPFIPVNCSALPEHLLESEVFGWVKGAFTGANSERKGLIEEADGGTFFLDEIGDLPLSLQAKFLRVLQEKETRRLGENKIRKIDVRFISATNKNLEEEVKEKRFREDLYYRIKGVIIHLPPLRERKEDIPLLTNYFIEKYCNEMGRSKVHLSSGALEALISYPWPGNVRELESEIRNTIMLLDPERKIIDIDDLPPNIASQRVIKLHVGENYDLTTAKEIFEKNYIEEILKRNNWNRKKTAEALNITRQGLFKLMKKYRISENE